MLKRFFQMGSFSVKSVCHAVFGLGSILVFMDTLSKAGMFKMMHTSVKQISTQVGQEVVMKPVENTNVFMVVVLTLIYFLVAIFIWRLVCEMLYIVLQGFKSLHKEA